MADVYQTLTLAKGGKLTRSELFAKMSVLAEERREPGQSREQAFTKFVSGGEGAELMRLHLALGVAGSGGIVPDYAAAQTFTPVAKSSGTGGWHELVAFLKRAHKRSHPHDTDAKANAAAVNAALATEEGRYMFSMQKRNEQIATGQFTIADMEALDGARAEQQRHVDMHKRSSRSEFEDMVDELMTKRPSLSNSAAQDHVRSTPDGKAAWLKYKGKPGENGLKPGHSADDGSRTPYVPTTSGRTDPARAALWESPNASGPVTPARAPERPSEAPKIKRALEALSDSIGSIVDDDTVVNKVELINESIAQFAHYVAAR